MTKKKMNNAFGKRVSGSILTEGKVRKGGIKPKPSSPKPNIISIGQKSSSIKCLLMCWSVEYKCYKPEYRLIEIPDES